MHFSPWLWRSSHLKEILSKTYISNFQVLTSSSLGLQMYLIDLVDWYAQTAKKEARKVQQVPATASQ